MQVRGFKAMSASLPIATAPPLIAHDASTIDNTSVAFPKDVKDVTSENL
jgi:hypothetical protein